MIACVPVIAVFGIVWELKHHEKPVGSWWFGHGARPLPPLPGEKPPRRCCGCLVARSKKEVKADAEKAAGDASESAAALMATDRLGSDMTLVPPPTKSSSRWACCLPWCAKRDKNKDKGKTPGESVTQEPTTPPASPSVESAGSFTTDIGTTPMPTPKDEDVVEDTPVSSPSSTTETPSAPSPAEKIPSEFQPESMSHAGVRRVVIRREEREFGLEVEERV